MRRLPLQCATLFVLAFIADAIACVHVKTLVENQVVFASGTVLALHYLGFFNLHWFTEQKDPLKRFFLTTSTGLGAALGSAVVCLFSKG